MKPRKRDRLPTKDEYAAGKDGKNGRFLPGNPGGPGGRVARPDLYMVALRKAKEHGIDLEAELWEALLALLVAAKDGDVSALKLLFDRLTNPDPVEVNVNDNSLTKEQRLARIRQILGAAAAKKVQQDGSA